MKSKYDGKPIELTPRLEASLIESMKAVCEMMAVIDGEELWANGRCQVEDLSRASGICFHYGPKDYFDDGLGDFAVVEEEP